MISVIEGIIVDLFGPLGSCDGCSNRWPQALIQDTDGPEGTAGPSLCSMCRFTNPRTGRLSDEDVIAELEEIADV